MNAFGILYRLYGDSNSRYRVVWARDDQGAVTTLMRVEGSRFTVTSVRPVA